MCFVFMFCVSAKNFQSPVLLALFEFFRFVASMHCQPPRWPVSGPSVLVLAGSIKVGAL